MEKKYRVSRIQQYCCYFSLCFISRNTRAPPIRYGDYNVICFTFFTPIFTRWCSTSFMLTPIVLVAGSHFPSALYYLYRPCHVAHA